MSRPDWQQEHVDVLMKRYMAFRRLICPGDGTKPGAGGTKDQRKEYAALKWVLKLFQQKLLPEPVPEGEKSEFMIYQISNGAGETRYIISSWDQERVARLLENRGDGFEIETTADLNGELGGTTEIIL